MLHIQQPTGAANPSPPSARKSGSSSNASASHASPPLKGAKSAEFQLHKLDLDSRVGLGLMARSDGLIVVTLAPDGLAAKAGIKVGFKIVRINRKQINSVSEANKILSMAIGPLLIEVLLPQKIAPKDPPKKLNIGIKPMLQVGPPEEKAKTRYYLTLSSRNKIAQDPTQCVIRAVCEQSTALGMPCLS